MTPGMMATRSVGWAIIMCTCGVSVSGLFAWQRDACGAILGNANTGIVSRRNRREEHKRETKKRKKRAEKQTSVGFAQRICRGRPVKPVKSSDDS